MNDRKKKLEPLVKNIFIHLIKLNFLFQMDLVIIDFSLTIERQNEAPSSTRWQHCSLVTNQSQRLNNL